MKTTAPDPECQDRLDDFVSRYGVRRFKLGYRTLLTLLKQGGAPPDEIRAHLVQRWRANPGQMQLGDYYGEGAPFDHGELWGRNGIPLFLIGHPYQVNRDAVETLAAIGGLGMNVMITDRSWYRPGTVQVMVNHWGTTKNITGES